MLKVSVIVPVYNVEKYVAKCLESLIAQTMQDIEILCINDGSTDTSSEILKKYSQEDSRIQIFNKPNTGYGNSMNLGLAKARGEYIAIVESDDYAERNMLETLYNAAVNSDADIVKGEYFRHQNGRDDFADRMREYQKGKLISVHSTPSILFLADTIWSALYRRDFLEKNHIIFHETPGASFQDISFALQGWLLAEKVFFLGTPVLHYRIDNPDSSLKNPKKIFCVFEEYEWVEERFHDVWCSFPKLEKYFLASKYRDYFNHYYRVDIAYQYALLLRLRSSFEKDLHRGKIDKEAFPDFVWKELQEVITDLDSFYDKTAKKTMDVRLEFCKIKNDIIYIDIFFQKLEKYPQVIIYGAGKIGKLLAKTFLKKGKKPYCFAVTMRSDEETEYRGIPIQELCELQDFSESSAVILAVAEKNQYELYMNLEQYGFKNIYRVDSVILKYCRSNNANDKI